MNELHEITRRLDGYGESAFEVVKAEKINDKWLLEVVYVARDDKGVENADN